MSHHQWICRRDVVSAVTRLIGTAAVSLLPAHAWSPVSTAIGLSRLLWHPRLAVWQLSRGFKRIPDHASIWSRLGLSVRFSARHVEERFQYLREHRPGGWNPSVRLRGREHIEDSLSRGRGAILWAYPFFGKLAFYKAMRRAGFSLVLLSHAGHGCVSQSHFARRFLNQLMVDVENRSLAERITMPQDGSLAYLRKIVDRLEGNNLLVFFIADFGHRLLEFPFQGGVLRFATGAPYLATLTGARLIPVFWTRKGPNDFEVTAEAPLDSDAVGDRRSAIDHLSRQYVRLLETYAARDPADFWGWDRILSR